DRPTANDWEDALVKTLDLLQPCLNKKGCPKKWYVFANTSKPVCPYCGTPFKGQLPVLDFYSSRDGKNFRPDNHRLMVFDGQHLYPWHTMRNIFPNEKLSESDKHSLGYFIFHKNSWILVNTGLDSLTDMSTNKQIKIGSYAALKDGLKLQLSKEQDGRVCNVSLVKV
ncbi:MAG: kinase, partial [Deltaproteobacteria bacterium]|nr:kinase [Deltaproteobacteria bacterium]